MHLVKYGVLYYLKFIKVVMLLHYVRIKIWDLCIEGKLRGKWTMGYIFLSRVLLFKILCHHHKFWKLQAFRTKKSSKWKLFFIGMIRQWVEQLNRPRFYANTILQLVAMFRCYVLPHQKSNNPSTLLCTEIHKTSSSQILSSYTPLFEVPYLVVIHQVTGGY